MGYETKIFIVYQYDFTGENGKPKTGDLLAEIALCKCGGGPFDTLRSSCTPKDKALFMLWDFSCDRQQEGVELLRKIAENPQVVDAIGTSEEYLQDLSNDLEDSGVTKDKYGEFLSVMLVPDVIEAMKAEESYRRFDWAIATLEAIWAGSSPHEQEKLRVIGYGY